MSDCIQVLTTVERQEDAQAIARTLVDDRLAACVQIVGPITSIYRWQGEIRTAQEWQCFAKTRRALYSRVEQTIRRLHPYQVPEILAIDIAAGCPDYLAWLEKETKKDES